MASSLKSLKHTSWLVFSLLFFFLIPSFLLGLEIVEVYPNPKGSDTTGEYFVLQNNASTPFDLSTIVITTGSSSFFLPGVSLPPYAFFMVADEGFQKDNASWPDPDFFYPLTLRNTAGNLTLYQMINNTSLLLDTLAWSSVSEGKAITHHGMSHPSPKTLSESYAVHDLPFHIIVLEEQLSLMFSDDLPEEGYQVFPYPSTERPLWLDINTTCTTLTVHWWNQTTTLMAVNNTAQMSKNLTSFIAPGNYTVVVEGCGMQKSLAFTVLPIIGLLHEPTNITCKVSQTKPFCNASVTITNIGNVPFLLSLTPDHPTPFLQYGNQILNDTLLFDDPWGVAEQRTLQFVVNGTTLAPGNYTSLLHLEARLLETTS